MTTLGEIAAERPHAFVDGPFGSNLPASCYSTNGVPVVRGSNLSLGEVRFKDDDFVYVPDEVADRLKRSTCEPLDILFTKKGTIGQTGIIPACSKRKRYLLSGNQLKLTVNREKADPLFVYYSVSSPASRAKVIRDSTVTGVPKTNLAYLKTFPIWLPPLPEQKAIAAVLGALDDKIELNRRMNETLEALAQGLFQNIMNQHRQSTNAWRKSTIGEEVRVVGGSTPSTTKPEFWEGGVFHWATPKDLANLTSPVLLGTERKITREGVAQISSGLLPAGTVLLSSRAPIGYLAISEVPVAVNQGFIAMVCDKELPNHFVRLWAKQNMDVIEANANGTTFLEISKSNFRPLTVDVPPPKLLESFTRSVGPLHRRMVSNLKESRTLAALRDALLPKLLSGSIRVHS